MSSFLAGLVPAFYLQPARPPRYTSPLYHTTKLYESQVKTLLQKCYRYVTSLTPLPTSDPDLSSIGVVSNMYTVYNVQASWVAYKLQRHRPAGYCIQAALAGQLERRGSWNKLNKLDRPEIEIEKFSNVYLFRSWVTSFNHTKNPIAQGIGIPIKIRNMRSCRNRIFRHRGKIIPNSERARRLKNYYKSII